MTMERIMPVTTEPPAPGRIRQVLRGLLAVARLVGGAVPAFLGALVGTPGGAARTVRNAIVDEYRAGKVGAVDADVTEEDEDR